MVKPAAVSIFLRQGDNGVSLVGHNDGDLIVVP